ncbi:hypothetical protein [Heyndrickxia ginsengihumi]|uniref:hypothetical protein n=1 Tax=Heyndrickxia ginsengihumi TaxID=363870 RepID=UPI003D1E28A8
MAKANLKWVKKQDCFFDYKNDPKWENMLEHDKRIRRILGSYSHEKLMHNCTLQEAMKKELIKTYESRKLSWKIK